MRNDGFYSSFGSERRRRRRRRKLEEWMLYFLFCCHRMELIVAYYYYCGGTAANSMAQHLLMLLFNSFLFSIRYVIHVQIRPKFIPFSSLRYSERWYSAAERASECMMICEHRHNDLFSHIKTHAQHLNLSFVFKHSRIFVVSFLLFFSLAIFNSTETLDLNCMLFCSRTYSTRVMPFERCTK